MFIFKAFNSWIAESVKNVKKKNYAVIPTSQDIHSENNKSIHNTLSKRFLPRKKEFWSFDLL